MILPIVAYGDPVLRKKAVDITKDYPGLSKLIANMFDTMNNSKGVGIAAPQVGVSIRLFIIDTAPYVSDDDDDEEEEDDEDEKEVLRNFKKIFINAQIVKEDGEKWKFNEGCLSIPTIREDVERQPEVRIRYLDENFVEHEESYKGLRARIIQHEYDHIDGILFTDKINPLRKRLLKRKLSDISKGLVEVSYKMKFFVKK
jgi:peptide deformylase